MKKKLSFLLLLSILILSLSFTVQAAVKLNKTKATITVGKKVQLTLKGYSGTVKWSTSNKKIATVSSKGKVTGKKAGNCTITAKAGKKKYTCKIKVKKASAVPPATATPTPVPTSTPTPSPTPAPEEWRLLLPKTPIDCKSSVRFGFWYDYTISGITLDGWKESSYLDHGVRVTVKNPTLTYKGIAGSYYYGKEKRDKKIACRIEFKLYNAGTKAVEIRSNGGKYSSYQPGEEIKLNRGFINAKAVPAGSAFSVSGLLGQPLPAGTYRLEIVTDM